MNLISLSVTQLHLKELEDIAKESLPNESCAILLGEINPINLYTVKKIIKMENIVQTWDYFEINPIDLLDVYRKSKDLNLDVIGIFHSHPSIAHPSKTDLLYMEINPVIWLIYSTTESVFRAFFLDEEKKINKVVINQVTE